MCMYEECVHANCICKKASSRPGLQGNCEDTLVVLPVQIVVTFTSRKRAEDFFFFQVASWAVSCSGIWSVVCMCSELNTANYESIFYLYWTVDVCWGQKWSGSHQMWEMGFASSFRNEEHYEIVN